MIAPSRAGLRLARIIPLCLTPLLASASTDDPVRMAWRDAGSLPELVRHLEGWIDANGDLPRRDEKPAVQFIEKTFAASLSALRPGADADRLRGAYDPDRRTIWLVRPWSARDPRDVAVLLHELIHHRQAVAGHWYCPGAQELPAYRAQRKWLSELGLELRANWIAVVLESGCTPRDIHPD